MATANHKPAGPRTIKASEFKARCLELMDEVAESGQGPGRHDGADRRILDWPGQLNRSDATR